MFSVVKTRKSKKSRATLTVVPSTWAGNNCVFWPPSDLVTLARNAKSKPEMKWKATEGKVLATAETFELAEERLSELLSQTDSEDTGIGTRAKPAAKKQKFISSSYVLSEAIDQSTANISTSQPKQVKVQPTTPSTKANGSALSLAPVVSTILNPGSIHQQLQTAPASGFAQGTIPRISLVSAANAPASGTAVSLGSSLSVKPNNELMSTITIDGTIETLNLDDPSNQLANTSQQMSSNVAPEDVLTMQFTDEQLQFIADMVPNEVPVTMDPIEISGQEVQVRTQNGIHTFIQLEDGSYLPLNDVNQINAKLDAHGAILLKIFDFMANIDRFLRKSSPGEILLDNVEAAESEDCAKSLKIQSIADLTIFENKLQDSAFTARMLKHCKFIYSLTGKREGAPFFRSFLRNVLNPHTLENYSWQGVSRDGEKENFQDKFPRFIDFVFNVVRAADFQFTKEANEKSFQTFLRQKNVEIKRFDESGKQRRSAFSRKRKFTNSNKLMNSTSAEEKGVHSSGDEGAENSDIDNAEEEGEL